jgi:proteasome lid subunit RPN8/RPN11
MMTPPSLPPLILDELTLKALAHHAQSGLPEEICGLLAGSWSRPPRVIPIENELHSPNRFRMNPLEQLRAFEQIESAEEELLAIYHSHPAGPPHPSETDIAEAFYPVYTVILSPDLHAPTWRTRVFWIENGIAHAK